MSCSDARRFGVSDKSHFVRQRRLHVEHQPVLAASREVVQADAQLVDQPLVARNFARFDRSHQFVPGELAPRATKAGGARDPDDGLQVAQPARTFLDVGLEVVRGVLVPQMALLLLENFRFVKPAHIQRRREAAAKAIVQRTRPIEQPMLEQAGTDRHVARHFRFAFVDGAHRVRNFEPGVPELADEAFDRAFRGAVGERPWQQDEYIDVRVRKQSRATVATDRDECGVGGCADLGPDAPDDAIRKLRLTQQQALRLEARGKGCTQRPRGPPRVPASSARSPRHADAMDAVASVAATRATPPARAAEEAVRRKKR